MNTIRKKIPILAVFLLLLTVPVLAAVPPVADFSANPTTGMPPLTVRFTGLSANNPDTFAWFFGDETYAQSWTRMTSGARWTARLRPATVATPDGTLVLMGGHDDRGNRNDVWKSVDKGATWTLVNASPGWSVRHAHAAVALSDGSIILTGGFAGNAKSDVWKSADNGATWTLVTANPGYPARYYHTMEVLPDDSIVIMGGFGNTDGRFNDVWRSTDGGIRWTQMTANAEWTKRDSHTSAALPDGSLVLMGGYDGKYENDTWRSTDNGATWTEVNASSGWAARRIFAGVAMPDNSIVLTGGYDDASRKSDVWRSTDAGATWTRVSSSPGWPKRSEHTMVVLPDASIVLMGGYDNVGSSLGDFVKNDTWRLQPAGSREQNPVHTYASEGTYDVALQVSSAAGRDSTIKTEYITVGTTGIIPLPGYTSPPTDPDNDGIYEDLNANGRLDFADISLYFTYMEWIAENEPIAAFDPNGNSRIDFADITALFNEIG